MMSDDPFIIQTVGNKFEIVPYFTKAPEPTQRYRVTIRQWAPPGRHEYIATPLELLKLLEWLRRREHALLAQEGCERRV